MTKTTAPEGAIYPLRKIRIAGIGAIELLEFEPEETGITLIEGENGIGKSTAVSALFYLIGGAKARPSDLVQRGIKQAEISVEFDLYRISQPYKPGSDGTLKITPLDGSTLPPGGAQTFLNSLFDQSAIDPLAAAHGTRKEQDEAFFRVVKLPINLEAKNAERKRLFDDRTSWNRTVKDRQSVVDNFRDVPKDRPAVDSTEAILARKGVLQEDAKAFREAQAATEEAERRAGDAAQLVTAKNARVTELKAALALAEREAALALSAREAADNAVDAAYDAQDLLTDPAPEIAALDQQLANAGNAQALLERWNSKRTAEISLAEAKAKSDALTKGIADIDAEKTAALAAAPMPLPDLGYTEEHGIMWKGLPLSTASEGETLRIWFAIAMSAEPRVRVLPLRHGHALDAKNRRLLQEMALERHYQVLFENVAPSSQIVVRAYSG